MILPKRFIKTIQITIQEKSGNVNRALRAVVTVFREEHFCFTCALAMSILESGFERNEHFTPLFVF